MSVRPRVLVAALALLSAGCAVHPRPHLPPPTSSIVLDGHVLPDEWGIPSSVPLRGDVHLRLDEQFLYVAVRSNTIRPVHLYLARADEVQVLHASGSLGRAIYRRSLRGEWQLVSPFEWQVRDPAFGRAADAPDVEAERSAYIERNGWAANTIRMGNPGQVEFKVRRHILEEQDLQLAISYFWVAPDSSEQIRHWPEGAEITPEEYPLLMGESVPAQFVLQGWFPRSRSTPRA